MLKELGNLASLVKQAQEMHGRMVQVQENLARLRVEGTAGGGMVTVEASGQQKILKCQIDPSLFESGDQEMVEELITAAANQALEKAKQLAAEEFGKAAGGVNFTGMEDVLVKLGLPTSS